MSLQQGEEDGRVYISTTLCICLCGMYNYISSCIGQPWKLRICLQLCWNTGTSRLGQCILLHPHEIAFLLQLCEFCLCSFSSLRWKPHIHTQHAVHECVASAHLYWISTSRDMLLIRAMALSTNLRSSSVSGDRVSSLDNPWR